MNIFGNEEEEPQTEDTKVISNSLGIDLGTLNTVIAKQYMENLKELSAELQLEDQITLEYVASLPDVLNSVPDVENEVAMLKKHEQGLPVAKLQAVITKEEFLAFLEKGKYLYTCIHLYEEWRYFCL